MKTASTSWAGLEPQRVASTPDVLVERLPLQLPPLWDGKASERIAYVVERSLP